MEVPSLAQAEVLLLCCAVHCIAQARQRLCKNGGPASTAGQTLLLSTCFEGAVPVVLNKALLQSKRCLGWCWAHILRALLLPFLDTVHSQNACQQGKTSVRLGLPCLPIDKDVHQHSRAFLLCPVACIARCSQAGMFAHVHACAPLLLGKCVCAFCILA